MSNFIAWHDLRATCKVCNKRADFTVEYSNRDLHKNYLTGGTRIIGYCLKHLPDEIKINKQRMIIEAQKPLGDF